MVYLDIICQNNSCFNECDLDVLQWNYNLSWFPPNSVILQLLKLLQLFTFSYISFDEIKHEVLNLKHKKASREVHIPVNILKDVTDTYLSILSKIINSSTEQNKFQNNLDLVYVLPIFKQKDHLNKENYKV